MGRDSRKRGARPSPPPAGADPSDAEMLDWLGRNPTWVAHAKGCRHGPGAWMWRDGAHAFYEAATLRDAIRRAIKASGPGAGPGDPGAPAAGSVFDRCVKIDWPALWASIGTRRAHSAECDDREGLLSVLASEDGYLHLALDPHPMAAECGGGFGSPTFRARTFAGGGRGARIRAALALLALAILEDGGQDDAETT